MPSTGPKGQVGTEWRDELKSIIVTAGVILEQGKVLVTQRKKGAPHELLWEFPGGKVMEGEEPREALRRELKEELDIDAQVGMIFEAVFHPCPEHPVLLLSYLCRIEKGTPKRLGCHDLRWVNLIDLEKLAMPPADNPVRKRLCSSKGFIEAL